MFINYTPAYIILNGNVLKETSTFNYLGSVITNNKGPDLGYAPDKRKFIRCTNLIPSILRVEFGYLPIT
jgi:hypothetical protein